MDNISSVGTQYIICECGDNFPNEKFLNIHLANDHGEVEAFLCDECPEAFTSNNSLSHHKRTHKKKTEPLKRPELMIKTYTRKSQQKQNVVKPPVIKNEIVEKKPPVIKLSQLKRIDSISLIQNLKSLGGIIKLASVPKPGPDQAPEPEPEPEPEPFEVPVVMEEGQAIGEGRAEEGQIMEEAHMTVKSEAMDEAEEIYYQCDVCNSIFYTEWDFNVHYQSKHALKLEPGSAEHILEQHLVQEHAGDEGVKDIKAEVETAFYYECELCHKIFASEKYFNIHYNKTHGGLLAITEEDEGDDGGVHGEAGGEESPRNSHRYSQKATIIQEQGEAQEPEPAPESKPKTPEQVIYYKCDLCKILYPTERAYNLHFEKKHGAHSSPASQGPASAGFQLLEQELSEDYTAVPLEVFTCEFCTKTFTMKRSLQVHRKRTHADELRERSEHAATARAASRSKVCDVCGRAYNSNAALRYHQRRHTGEKPYACTICPKRFTMPMFLQIHLRTHTGEKPYECPLCPKAFTNKAALIRHDRVHTGVKPYECPECGKFFTQSNSMKLHVSTVHLKLPAPYKSKSRRSKSEARALQLALKSLPAEDLILGD